MQINTTIKFVPYRSFVIFSGNAVCYGEKYTVSLFDNSGLQQYEGLRNFTYKESSVIVVCFSMVDRNSFYNVRDFWIPEIRNCVGSTKAIILVGIHSENTEETANNDVISIDEAHELAKVIRARNFIECSTKDFDAVNKVFEHVAKTAIKLRKLFSIGKFWGK